MLMDGTESPALPLRCPFTQGGLPRASLWTRCAMSFHRWCVVIAIVSGSLFPLNGGDTYAQIGRPQMVPANLPELTVTGDVVAVVPGYVRVASSADRTWDLQITPKTKIGVKGKAKADYLAAGDCISFVANVDVRHARVTDEKINKLTLFTPDNRRPLMAIRGGTGLSGMDNKAGEPGNAGAGGGAFAGNPFGGAAAQGDGFGGTEKPSGRKGMASGKKGAGRCRARVLRDSRGDYQYQERQTDRERPYGRLQAGAEERCCRGRCRDRGRPERPGRDPCRQERRQSRSPRETDVGIDGLYGR